MEAPMCKLCKERHWSGVCPKFARISPKEKLARATAIADAHSQAEKAAQPAKAKKRKKAKRKKKAVTP